MQYISICMSNILEKGMKQIRTWEYQYEGILPFLVNILGLGFTAEQPLMSKPHVHAKVSAYIL